MGVATLKSQVSATRRSVVLRSLVVWLGRGRKREGETGCCYPRVMHNHLGIMAARLSKKLGEMALILRGRSTPRPRLAFL